MGGFIAAGALAFAALIAPEPPRARIVVPVTVNEVVSANQFRCSVELSLLIEVLNPPATHGEAIRAFAGKTVMVEVPLYDDLSRSVGERGVKARIVTTEVGR